MAGGARSRGGTHPVTPIPGLALFERSAPAGFEGARCRRFEVDSRGDRVPGRLLLPAEPGPHPLILLIHGARGSIDSEYMQASAPWVRGGAAVASIDLPLHGERSSAKLSERLLSGLERAGARPEDPLPTADHLLWLEFVRQAVSDLGAALDGLAGHPEIDGSRIGFAGFSLGAMLGARFCGEDARPRAAALALAGGGFGPPEVDPCSAIAGLSPRPLLMVNASDDRVVVAEATERLFEAARDPKRLEWYDGDHSTLPGAALKAMWTFLKEPLQIPG